MVSVVGGSLERHLPTSACHSTTQLLDGVRLTSRVISEADFHQQTGLSEYNAFWRCVQAGATYLFVQLCKMLFLATFFPTWEGGAGVYDFVGEFMKSTVDLADLLGLHLVMSRNAGKGEYKIMVAAMGWATAELVMSRFLPLWVGARGIEFDWKYIQMSFDSNISLVHYIAMAAVVWMFTRYDLPKSFRLPVTVLLALCVYKAFLIELFVHVFLLGSWTVLLVKAVLTDPLKQIQRRGTVPPIQPTMRDGVMPPHGHNALEGPL
ncbi:hypothetical protein CRENBAI_003575 [Crenichthys baileyi]|uniref:BOS complex subunit TMEM147 n=1 Tax=Crenichthys baileyi TaxID=28760 RepID=A0AAV9SKC9_9TELE